MLFPHLKSLDFKFFKPKKFKPSKFRKEFIFKNWDSGDNLNNKDFNSFKRNPLLFKLSPKIKNKIFFDDSKTEDKREKYGRRRKNHSD
jgi:hypothetical protein